jgi:EmrB/QacA subfamily drug resistance transporter
MKRTTMVALLIASAQAPFGSTLIAVALPSIGNEVGVDLVLITSLLVTSYLIVNVVCQGPAGKLSDLVGHSRVMWAGIILYAIGALVGLLAQDAGLLVVSRCTMAAAGAMMIPATLALLRLYVPPERRGVVFGIFGATMGFAAAAGPALGGEIVNLWGWRVIFFANLPFLAVAAILLRAFPLPEVDRASDRSASSFARSFDFIGVGLMAVALSLFVISSKAGGTSLVACLSGAIIAGTAFIFWETKLSEPIFDLHLFGLPAFSAGTSITELQNFAMYGLLFQLPQFFSVFRGSLPRDIGYMLFVMMIGMVVAAPIGGRLTDQFGARRAALLGVTPLLIASLMLWRLTSFVHPQDALLSLLLFGIGMGLCNAPAQSAAMAAVQSEQAGSAAGVSLTMRYMGSISGIVVLSAVLGNDGAVSAERHELMATLFVVAIGLAALVSLGLPGKLTVANRATRP